MANENSQKSSAPPQWLEEHQSAVVTWIVWLLTLVVVTVVVSSMVLSLVLRIYMSARWEELGAIGDFWGGHLSGVALAVVAVSLLIQRYEFGLQQQEFKNQKKEMEDARRSINREIEVMEEGTSQARAHFMLEQLRELGNSLEFVVVRHSAREGDGRERERERYSGVPRLSLFSKHYFDDTEDIEAIVCDFGALREFVLMGSALRDVIGRMPDATRVWSTTLLEALFPLAVEKLYKDFVKTQDDNKGKILSLDLSIELRAYLCALITEGWEVRLQGNDSNCAAALVRDLVVAREYYATDGVYCASLEEALANVVGKKRAAGA